MLCARIQGTCGLIEKEDGSIFEKSASDSDALTLPHTQVAATLANGTAESFRHFADKIEGLGLAGGLDDFLFCRSGFAIGDILANRGREKNRVLENHPDMAAEAFFADATDVRTIERNRTRCGIVEAWNQAQERAFSRSCSTDKGDGLPRLNGEVDILDNHSFARIPEIHMGKLDATGGFLDINCIRSIRDIIIPIQHLKTSCSTGSGPLECPCRVG